MYKKKSIDKERKKRDFCNKLKAMQYLIFYCFCSLMIAVSVPERSYSPGELLRTALLCGGAGAAIYLNFGGALAGGVGLFCAVSRMLVALPFRAYCLLTCEVGSGFFWRVWAVEQGVQTVSAVAALAWLSSLSL
jgi:hypothetical protein